MFVNHNKWISNNTGELLLKRLDELKDKLNYWDQDVLNSFFDGEYVELNDAINYPLNLRWPVPFEEIEEDKLFIHYQSNNKPWNIRGCFNEGSNRYNAMRKAPTPSGSSIPEFSLLTLRRRAA